MTVTPTHRLAQLLLVLPFTVAACDSPDPGRDEHPTGGDAGDDGADDDDGTADDGGDDGAAGEARAPFFLPTGEPDNTAAPTVEVDEGGGIHMIYPAYAGGDAYYGYCPVGCAGPDDVSVVRLPTDGTTANAMLALDAEGHPQVLLSTFATVDYATCDGDCTDASSWTVSTILKHDGDREVTGEAFALDPQGRPRFLMHTYVALLGIGQKAPETHYVTCDAECHDPASWGMHRISGQIWRSSKLLFDAQGRPRAATAAIVSGENGAPEQTIVAYAECNDDCTEESAWLATGLELAFATEYDAVAVKPAVSMDLTTAGAPRIAAMSQYEGVRNIVYLACDSDCVGDGWSGVILTEGDDLGPGVDLALDADDHPRFVYTFDYNIGLAHCEEDRCETPEAPWDLVKVELGGEMPPDEIFLYPNCNVSAWFLHSPSLAITDDGRPHVGYQARDISGGWSNPDPDDTPDCVAGTDMTWSRLALLATP